jgi:hypothetical protein
VPVTEAASHARNGTLNFFYSPNGSAFRLKFIREFSTLGTAVMDASRYPTSGYQIHRTPFFRLPGNPVLLLDYCTVAEFKPTDVNSLEDM